mmetsp:Transcript_90323/g.206600  ORF Transcript_90323/g.206600 Transcript_90323/m.206600 type:complete len:213 (+) Transcript_90323:647-1285(+)
MFWVGAATGIVNTVSMECTTPLPLCMSALATATPFTVKPLPVFTRFKSEPSTEAGVDVSAALSITLPGTTWYFSRAAKASLSALNSSKVFPVSPRYCAKAGLVGAKTVNGPAPIRVVTKSAAIRASTKLVKSELDLATSTTLGINTLSIGWTTPLPANTSSLTVAPLAVTAAPSFTRLNLPVAPYKVSASPVATSAAIVLPVRMWYFTMLAS